MKTNPNIVQFEVAGKPETQGSKQPFAPTYGDGTVVRRHKASCPGSESKDMAHHFAAKPCKCPVWINTVEDNDAELGAWRDTIRWHAKVAMGGRDLFSGIVEVTLVFIKPRAKSHYGTGRNERLLKDAAPAAPGMAPDALKLGRAVEDALKTIVYTDDSLGVTLHIGKRYCARWEPQRVIVRVEQIEAQTVGDLVRLGLMELPPPDAVGGDQLDLLSLAQVA